jgi:hypothetical protein
MSEPKRENPFEGLKLTLARPDTGVVVPEKPPQIPPPSDDDDFKGGQELVITLDVPEDMSDAQVEKLIAESVRFADGLHRAYGGHGLTVADRGVQVYSRQPAMAGGGV